MPEMEFSQRIKKPMKPVRVLLLCIFLILPAALSAQMNGYHYRYDYWLNRAVRGMTLQHPQVGIRLSEMPYTRSDAVKSLVQLEYQSGIYGFYKKKLFSLFKSSLKNSTPRHFELNWRIRPQYAENLNANENARLETDLIGYTWWGDDLAAYFNFQFDTDGITDRDYHGTYEWKDVVGDMRAAYLQYKRKHWSLLFGREFVHWGPGRTGALLTSGLAPSLDMIKFSADIWKFRFYGFNSMLGKTDQEQLDNVHRYFSGHRLSLRLPRIELGLSETVMYGGENEIVHHGYLNPLIPYYFMDVMGVQNRKDNVTLAMDAAFYYPDKVRWYGQFLVDEYYYEGEDYPNRTALLLGMDWFSPLNFNPLWLNAEYVRIDRWTYNYEAFAPWNRLNYYNAILGHPLGPDADLVHVEAEYALSRDFLLDAQIQHMRQGETTIDTPLITKEELGEHHPPFPYGTIEKNLIFSLQLQYFPAPHWYLFGYVQYKDISNAGHVEGNSDSELAWRLGLMYNLRLVF
ncbi:hypothetical protein GF407_04530 [candidate division KSB1 bacterium]|nr:hypothetical protein [candidate division KSB1 bacterium]